LDTRKDWSLEMVFEDDPQKLPAWDFEFTMQRRVAAQDLQTVKIWFNVPYDQENQLLGGSRAS